MEFRRARTDEAERLRAMTLAGVAHWGHDVNHPDAYAGLAANGVPTAEFIEANTVEVLIDVDSIVGFYSLESNEGYVELVHMFVTVDRIGTGLGRVLWSRAVSTASRVSDRLRLMSDPAAKGFYAAMGARLERDVEVAPGFALGEMWFDLAEDAASATPDRDRGQSE